jgi:glycosyltransferase involved in cell wall biosynthesis
MCLNVVITAYNEKNFVGQILQKVLNVELEKEVIIVDDFSTDGTTEVLKQLQAQYKDRNIRVLFHSVNQGKGAAIRTGLQNVSGDIVIIQDADLEYDPSDYHKIIKPIRDGLADVVYGSRYRGEIKRVLSFWHTLGNRILTLCSNVFTNLNLTDMETCYKAFKTDVIKQIPLRSNRFGFEPEITAKVARLGVDIFEVPISYHGRSYSEGKKINWKDGISAIYTILKYWLIDDIGKTKEQSLK